MSIEKLSSSKCIEKLKEIMCDEDAHTSKRKDALKSLLKIPSEKEDAIKSLELFANEEQVWALKELYNIRLSEERSIKGSSGIRLKAANG